MFHKKMNFVYFALPFLLPYFLNLIFLSLIFLCLHVSEGLRIKYVFRLFAKVDWDIITRRTTAHNVLIEHVGS